jgi:hypothetical protein
MKDELTKIDDEELIHLTIKGCTECFSVLFVRHSTAIRRYLRMMLKHTAGRVVSETTHVAVVSARYSVIDENSAMLCDALFRFCNKTKDKLRARFFGTLSALWRADITGPSSDERTNDYK